jgi:hypothetical protein
LDLSGICLSPENFSSGNQYNITCNKQKLFNDEMKIKKQFSGKCFASVTWVFRIMEKMKQNKCFKNNSDMQIPN